MVEILDRHGSSIPDPEFNKRKDKALAVLSYALQICDGLGFLVIIQPTEKGMKVQPIYNKRELNKVLVTTGFTMLHFIESQINNEFIKTELKVVEPKPEEKKDEQDQNIGG